MFYFTFSKFSILQRTALKGVSWWKRCFRFRVSSLRCIGVRSVTHDWQPQRDVNCCDQKVEMGSISGGGQVCDERESRVWEMLDFHLSVGTQPNYHLELYTRLKQAVKHLIAPLLYGRQKVCPIAFNFLFLFFKDFLFLMFFMGSLTDGYIK